MSNIYNSQLKGKWEKIFECISTILTRFFLLHSYASRAVSTPSGALQHHIHPHTAEKKERKKERKKEGREKKEDSFLFVFCDRMSWMCSAQW